MTKTSTLLLTLVLGACDLGILPCDPSKSASPSEDGGSIEPDPMDLSGSDSGASLACHQILMPCRAMDISGIQRDESFLLHCVDFKSGSTLPEGWTFSSECWNIDKNRTITGTNFIYERPLKDTGGTRGISPNEACEIILPPINTKCPQLKQYNKLSFLLLSDTSIGLIDYHKWEAQIWSNSYQRFTLPGAGYWEQLSKLQTSFSDETNLTFKLGLIYKTGTPSTSQRWKIYSIAVIATP